jgi:hypothetical protein
MTQGTAVQARHVVQCAVLQRKTESGLCKMRGGRSLSPSLPLPLLGVVSRTRRGVGGVLIRASFDHGVEDRQAGREA